MPKRLDIVEYLTPFIENVLVEIDSTLSVDEAKAALKCYLKSLADKIWDPRIPHIQIPWGVFRFSCGKMRTRKARQKIWKGAPGMGKVRAAYNDWVVDIERRECELGGKERGWFRSGVKEKYLEKMSRYFYLRQLHIKRNSKSRNETKK